ncbi:unnamed protein product [Brassica rapa]|uniref:Uncharacterized protein n=1 Tax=Brassica campestris TaxID=3711 RepID=A0A3P5Z0V8_BRACM|nr:unnamed protein product [Brassica rapa]VDC69295.1 unnamed protein product [Brassica rapa]
MKRVRDLASTKMSVNSRRARVACVIPSRLSSTSSRRALHAIHELDQGPTRPRHGTTLLQSLRYVGNVAKSFIYCLFIFAVFLKYPSNRQHVTNNNELSFSIVPIWPRCLGIF